MTKCGAAGQLGRPCRGVAAPAVGTSRLGDRQVRAATGCRAAPRRRAADRK